MEVIYLIGAGDFLRTAPNCEFSFYLKLFIFGKILLMAQPIKYMVDEKGKKTSVLIPLTTWTKINDDFFKLQNKLKVLMGIKSALKEVASEKKSGKKLQTLKDFLREVTVRITINFKSEAKPLLKKYKSLTNDLLKLEK